MDMGRLEHAMRRINWTHVVDGLDGRMEELRAHDQFGRMKANQRTIDAVQDLRAVLLEFDVPMAPDQ